MGPSPQSRLLDEHVILFKPHSRGGDGGVTTGYVEVFKFIDSGHLYDLFIEGLNIPIRNEFFLSAKSLNLLKASLISSASRWI